MIDARVVIGIPTLNGPERLDRCLKSIEDCTHPKTFTSVKLLVCDDGSTAENLKLNKDAVHRASWLRENAGLEMLMNKQRLGIAKSWNKLSRHQDADVVVLMNDDIEVVDDWLDVLVYSVTRNKNIGTVSLTSHTGVTKRQAYESMYMERPKLDYREAKLLWGGGSLLASGGAIFAFRRSVFDEVEGFDENFFCFYEEVDFGLRLIGRGLIPTFASYPSVFHLGGDTTTKADNMDHVAVMERSRTYFRQKWDHTLAELREELIAVQQAAPPNMMPTFIEWNSQIRDWNE